MKSKLKRGAALLLATATCLTTMVGSALAASPTFKDVPETHWAYSYVEQAVSDGIVNGMSPDVFSPSTQVTSAQFFAMLKRVFMPGASSIVVGEPWYMEYWRLASGYRNLIEGTNVTKENFNSAISRYDMAQALYNYNKKARGDSVSGYRTLYGITPAKSSQIKDYNSIPEKYRTAVLWAYGAGALKGDEKGNFNGSNVMNRAEAATVMVRMEDIIKACDKAEADAIFNKTLEHSKTSLYDTHQKVTYSDGRSYTKEYVDLLKKNAESGQRSAGNKYFPDGTYEVPATIRFRDETPNRKLSHIKFTIYVLEPYKDFGIPQEWIPACEYALDESSGLVNNSGSITFLLPISNFLKNESEVKIVVDDMYDLTNHWAYPRGAFELPFENAMCLDPDNYCWTYST